MEKGQISVQTENIFPIIKKIPVFRSGNLFERVDLKCNGCNK